MTEAGSILVWNRADDLAVALAAVQADPVLAPHVDAGRLGLVGGAFGIGFVVGPWLGGALARPELGAEGFQPPLLVAAALCVVATAGVLAFARESIQNDVAHQVRPGPLASLKEAWSDDVLRRLIAMTFTGFASFSAMWAIFGLWGEARFGWGPKEIGFVMGVTGVAAALSVRSSAKAS